ncbi:hypothetical protein [Spirosoma radiotolerans]|uniref:Uncharacterized protein n=1 Tax=Spirosoma radiotolerans TaxID=1379870 RepID=A0A0E3ZZJ5_9BACT|nr:hypothetical protein [Spirosoma radiotolerans]AKD57588.1 hypothetical protein SD10_24510 [Spirosoma radiotolerans]
MRPVSLLILLLLAGLTSCQSSSQPEPVQYSVPTEVELFVKSFRDEAKKRNNPVSTNNLIITFGTAVGEDICGECQLENGKTPRITLNSDAFCWQQASQYERECLVFHELGHCLLTRAHKTDKFPNGAFASLMNPNDVTVYATCRYPIGNDDCDRRPRRDYYIDELFDAGTPTPAWGK